MLQNRSTFFGFIDSNQHTKM